jgi:hypothetical protein
VPVAVRLVARFHDMAAHGEGPGSDDVVIVTGEPIVAALLEGGIAPREECRLSGKRR